jgi:hypothetical protein
MTKTELKELMEYLAAIDNRQLTTEKMRGWFDIIGYLDFHVAKQALIEAQRDPAIQYVEPKHIIAYARKVKEDLKTQQRRTQAVEVTDYKMSANNMPKCTHNVGLLFCNECCRAEAVKAGMVPVIPPLRRKVSH